MLKLFVALESVVVLVFEVAVVGFLLYLVLNLVRYLFFRYLGSGRGWWFALSDRWIRRDEKRRTRKQAGTGGK